MKKKAEVATCCYLSLNQMKLLGGPYDKIHYKIQNGYINDTDVTNQSQIYPYRTTNSRYWANISYKFEICN